jgi:hypothetical protein
MPYWSSEDHILKIKERYVPRQGQGSGRKFDGVFQTTEGRAFTLWKAAVESRFSMPSLYNYVKQFPADLAECLLPLFPDKKLPSELRHRPGTKDTDVLTVLEGDLRRLEDGIDQAFRDGKKRIGDLVSLEGIFDHYQVESLDAQIKVSRLLAYHRGQENLEARGVVRKTDGGRGWSKPLFYDLDEVDRLLNGLNIVAVAVECERVGLFDSRTDGQANGEKEEAAQEVPGQTKTALPETKTGQSFDCEQAASLVEDVVRRLSANGGLKVEQMNVRSINNATFNHATQVEVQTAASADILPPVNQNVDPTLTCEDVLILKAMADRALQVMNQCEIEAASGVSRKTVGHRLKKLLQWKLVRQPEGQRGGYVITQNGIEVMKQVP